MMLHLPPDYWYVFSLLLFASFGFSLLYFSNCLRRLAAASLFIFSLILCSLLVSHLPEQWISNELLLPLQEGGTKISFQFLTNSHPHAGSFFFFLQQLLNLHEPKSAILFNLIITFYSFIILFFFGRNIIKNNWLLISGLIFMACLNFTSHAVFSGEAAPLLWLFISVQLLIFQLSKEQHPGLKPSFIRKISYYFLQISLTFLIAFVRLEYAVIGPLFLTDFLWRRLWQKMVASRISSLSPRNQLRFAYPILTLILISGYFLYSQLVFHEKNHFTYILHSLYIFHPNLLQLFYFWFQQNQLIFGALFLYGCFFIIKNKRLWLPLLPVILFLSNVYVYYAHRSENELFRYYGFIIILFFPVFFYSLHGISHKLQLLSQANAVISKLFSVLLFALLLLTPIYGIVSFLKTDSLVRKVLPVFRDQQQEAKFLYTAVKNFPQCQFYSYIYNKQQELAIVKFDRKIISMLPPSAAELIFFPKSSRGQAIEKKCRLFLYGIDCNQSSLLACKKIKHEKKIFYTEILPPSKTSRYNMVGPHYFPFDEKVEISLYEL